MNERTLRILDELAKEIKKEKKEQEIINEVSRRYFKKEEPKVEITIVIK